MAGRYEPAAAITKTQSRVVQAETNRKRNVSQLPLNAGGQRLAFVEVQAGPVES